MYYLQRSIGNISNVKIGVYKLTKMGIFIQGQVKYENCSVNRFKTIFHTFNRSPRRKINIYKKAVLAVYSTKINLGSVCVFRVLYLIRILVVAMIKQS